MDISTKRVVFFFRIYLFTYVYAFNIYIYIGRTLDLIVT